MPSSESRHGAGRGAGHGTRWRRVRAAFTERLPYKGAAIALALLLWAIVTAEEQTAQYIDVRFVGVTDSSLTLVDHPPPMRALVVGRRRELLRLFTSPLEIRRAFGPDTPDSMRLELRPSDVDVPSGISVAVRDVQPRALTLRFSSVAERNVPVRVMLADSAGANGGAPPQVTPESVTVRGPRANVQRVASIATHRIALTAGDSLWKTVALDTAGLGLVVRPALVRVRLASAALPQAGDSASAIGAAVRDSAGDSARAPRRRIDSLQRDTARGVIVSDSARVTIRPPRGSR